MSGQLPVEPLGHDPYSEGGTYAPTRPSVSPQPKVPTHGRGHRLWIALLSLFLVGAIGTLVYGYLTIIVYQQHTPQSLTTVTVVANGPLTAARVVQFFQQKRLPMYDLSFRQLSIEEWAEGSGGTPIPTPQAQSDAFWDSTLPSCGNCWSPYMALWIYASPEAANSAATSLAIYEASITLNASNRLLYDNQPVQVGTCVLMNGDTNYLIALSQICGTQGQA